MTNYIQKYKIFAISITLANLLLLSGCSGKSVYNKNKISSERAEVINTAKQMLGVKYRYGGTTPRSGFDCSGLVQYSHKLAGVNVPRTTRQQYKSSKSISRRYLKPGDLVFFKTTVARIVSHVGIYLGNNKFIHAPSSGKRVKISSMKEKYWRKRFTGAGRVL